LTNDNHLRERLIQHKIYVAKYWEEVMQRPSVNLVEKNLVENLIPLPIDQRYNLDDMCEIIRVLNNYRK
jgi:hypothetical protein